MMKKIYEKPEISVVKVNAQKILCASGVNSEYGIGWGGVDESGLQDPD